MTTLVDKVDFLLIDHLNSSFITWFRVSNLTKSLTYANTPLLPRAQDKVYIARIYILTNQTLWNMYKVLTSAHSELALEYLCIAN